MTCIVGIAKNDTVYIGADSSSSVGNTMRTSLLPKVFEVGDFLIGYTWSFRMGQILQHHLTVPRQKDGVSDDAYMVKVFAENVRSLFKEHGISKIENNLESSGEFLVGYHGTIYCVCSDFQVNHYAENYAACGSGEDYALGSLGSTEKMRDVDHRIELALTVAARFSPNVRGPFMVKSKSW